MATSNAQSRHFGILAHSAEGAALCFTTFCHEGGAGVGADRHPDVTLDCIAMGDSMAAWEEGDYDTVRKILAKSVERLAKAGADFFACPDNTAHIVLEAPGAEFAIPALNIADIVAEDAKSRGMTKIAILGTKYTMEGPVYPRALSACGLDYEIPNDAEREDINRIIFEELVEGVFNDAARSRYIEVIERLAGEGCDGVALVCTEIPILITPEISPLPTLDSTRLLARKALKVARGEAPMPAWRGGPISSGDHEDGMKRAG